MSTEASTGIRAESFPRFDAADLHAAYNQYIYAPNREQLMARWVLWSEQTMKRLGEPFRANYGTGEFEKLEVFRTSRSPAPIHVHFRGGGWRHLMPRREHGFVAEMFVRAGAHFVFPDFEGIDKNGGNFAPIAQQVRRAVAWLYQNGAQFGGDPRQIYISGHSTGAHLAALVATTDWKTEFGLPPDLVKGAVCSSGIYDLLPAGISKRFPSGVFDEATVSSLSPIHHVAKLAAPIVVSYAKLETPGFCRQARDFAAALQRAGKPHTFIAAEQYNHLEILETLATPYGILGRLALEQMGRVQN